MSNDTFTLTEAELMECVDKAARSMLEQVRVIPAEDTKATMKLLVEAGVRYGVAEFCASQFGSTVMCVHEGRELGLKVAEAMNRHRETRSN